MVQKKHPPSVTDAENAAKHKVSLVFLDIAQYNKGNTKRSTLSWKKMQWQEGNLMRALHHQRKAIIGHAEAGQALFHLLMGDQSVMREMVGDKDGVLVRRADGEQLFAQGNVFVVGEYCGG